MEFRRSTRGMTAVDENVRLLAVGRGSLKRTAAVADALAKPGAVGSRGRGLAVRKTSASNAVAQPPAKLQKLRPLGVSAQQSTAASVCVRPTNAAQSKECDMLTEDYVQDIHEYVYDTEEQFLVDELFLSNKIVTSKMRSILIDWVIQVHQRFHLLNETLHLTVYIIDRYLEQMNVEKTELQLLGVSAMLAASKYEETYCPELKDFEFITDNLFNKKQIMRMEVGVVKATGFDLGRAHSIQFMRSFSQRAGASPSLHCVAKYFAELCLVEASFSSVRPSLIAAGSLWLADYVKGADLNLKKAFGSVADVDFMKEAVKTGKMIATWVLRVRRVGKLKAVTDKYATSRLYHASNLDASDETLMEKVIV